MIHGSVSAEFVGYIVSAETGESLAACVSVSDGDGVFVEIEGEHDHVQYLQKQWCYVDGHFEIDRDDVEGFTLEIRRGLEALPIKERLEAVSEQIYQLKRWINLADLGYMSGDTHVHYLKLEQCHLQMRAEDLEVLNLLTSDFTNDVEKFSGSLDPISTPGHWVYVGQEFRDWQQGHINLLRLCEIVEPLEPFGGSFRDRSYRHFVISPAAEEARTQQAAVTWAHFGDIPGTESPIAIALGLIDAVDLISQGDPIMPANKWPPWIMEQPSELKMLPALPAIELYYQYLNAGFHILLAAGTDKMSERIPVGSSRLYVWTGEDRSYDAWIEGLKAGNGFITNGPILSFSVDDYRSGQEIEFEGTANLTARCKAQSLHPFSRLQVMVNGEVVSTSSMPRRTNEGLFEIEINVPLELSESSWIAARLADIPRADREGMMPRRMTVFAHANPIYFLKNGSKIRKQSAIDYLTLYLRHTEHWFKTEANFETEEERTEALDYLEKAKTIYEAL